MRQIVELTPVVGMDRIEEKMYGYPLTDLAFF